MSRPDQCAGNPVCVLRRIRFFLLPAIAAVPLGIGALRTIDASEGRLRGRHLAVVGLCVSVVALSLWFLFFAVTWAGVNLVSGLVEMLMAPFG